MEQRRRIRRAKDGQERARLSRRSFLGGALSVGASLFAPSAFTSSLPSAPSLHLGIAPCNVEIASGVTVRTTAYNGAAPGPVLRIPEGQSTAVSIDNATTVEEYAHWHGFLLDSSLDGTPEENSLPVLPGQTLHYTLPPQPSGSFFIHSHAMAGRNLHAGAYTGQFSFVHVDSHHDPGHYDREFFLATHEWEPFFLNQAQEDKQDEEMHHLRVDPEDEGDPGEGGWEVHYRWSTINGRVLGHGEPLRVRAGEHILLHLLNASATESVQLALPGHVFEVHALDGHPVPHPRSVSAIELGVGERVDAFLEMNSPGVWVLGATDPLQRASGMGIVIEYAGQQGDPVWSDPIVPDWDYGLFANVQNHPAAQQELIFRIVRGALDNDGFEQWKLLSSTAIGEPPTLQQGLRYRFHLRNESDEWHPMHLHRNTFELTRFRGRTISGLFKDTVVVPPYGEVAFDFTPDIPGPALFHCHNQLHMDTGLKTLLNVS